MYEYYNKIERIKAAESILEEEADKIEVAEEQKVFDWVEQEELREQEEARIKAEEDSAKKAEDEAWMLEQLKKEHGEDFGNDIETDFNGD